MPIPKQRTKRVSELKVDRKDQVARDLESLKGKYFQLVTNAESALEAENPSPRQLKRFSQNYMKDRVVTTVEELFDCLEKFCFLDYALLESIISLLLKESQSVVCDLSDYIKQLSLFKKSTTLSEFVKSIEKAHTSLTTKGTGVCTVTIRLVGGWLEKTMEDLDRLLVEIFQDKTSILAHLKIVRGSVVIKYLAPHSETDSLIKLAQAIDSWIMLQFGVCELLIGRTVVVRDPPAHFSFESSLLNAVLTNEIKLLTFLLDIKTDPNANDVEGSALIYGCVYNRDEAVRLLLKANADPNFEFKKGVTALCIAIERRRSVIVRMLLHANANPDVQREYDGTSPLYVAAEKGFSDMVSILLKANANPNLQVDYGATALFVASQNGHTSTVRALLQADANPNIPKNNGVTPLFMAARYGHFDVVNCLLQANANPNLQKDSNGTTPLYLAAQDGRSDIVRILLKSKADPNLKKNDGTTPIFMASQFNHIDTVRILLRAKANPDLQRDDGASPLYIATYFRCTAIVGVLLHANANPNLQSVSGVTPLFMAAQDGRSDIVYMLLIAKTNPNLPNEVGITPIFMASQLGHTNTVNILLHANANPNLRKSDGTTPIFMASQFGHSDKSMFFSNLKLILTFRDMMVLTFSQCKEDCICKIALTFEVRIGFGYLQEAYRQCQSVHPGLP